MTSSAVRPAGRGPPCIAAGAEHQRGDVGVVRGPNDLLGRVAGGLAQLDPGGWAAAEGLLVPFSRTCRAIGVASNRSARAIAVPSTAWAQASGSIAARTLLMGSSWDAWGSARRSDAAGVSSTRSPAGVSALTGGSAHACDAVRADPQAHAAAAEPDAQLERCPSRARSRDRSPSASPAGRRPAKPNAERAPDAAHRREVQPAGSHVTDVVEIDPRGQAQQL